MIIEWNNLDYYLRNAPSISAFKRNILNIIRLSPNKAYKVYNPSGLKLLTGLCLGLSHLHAHKLSHNFSDCLDELCICGTNIETTNHFLLRCPFYLSKRQILMEKNRDIEILILDQNGNCPNKPFDIKNFCIFSATIEYILSTERFNVPL